MRIVFLLIAVAMMWTLGGCALWPKKKSSARIYEGDSPTIKWHESHAGGPVN